MGGGAKGLNTAGRTLILPKLDSSSSGRRQVSNLFNTLGHLAGDDLNDFGKEGPRRFKEGPLDILLT